VRLPVPEQPDDVARWDRVPGEYGRLPDP